MSVSLARRLGARSAANITRFRLSLATEAGAQRHAAGALSLGLLTALVFHLDLANKTERTLSFKDIAFAMRRWLQWPGTKMSTYSVLSAAGGR